MTNPRYVVTIVFYQSLAISFYPSVRISLTLIVTLNIIIECGSISRSWTRFVYFWYLSSPILLYTVSNANTNQMSYMSPCILSLLFCNLVKEAIMQFGQNKMDDCMATCRGVCARATRLNSGNWPFLQTKAFYIMSAVYRQAKDFDLANEYMEYSTEVRYSFYFQPINNR